jgi:hypothetical protein
MLSLCPVEPLPLLLPPPQPAIPAPMPANNSSPAHAYPHRFATGTRFRLSKNTIRSRHATIHIGPTGMFGMRRGVTGGAINDSAVVSVAVHDPGVELVPAVGVHVAAVPSALDPFMN